VGRGEGREVNKQCAACLALSNQELNAFIDFSSNFELQMALLNTYILLNVKDSGNY